MQPGVMIINSARKWIGEAAHCITLIEGLINTGVTAILVCRRGYALEKAAAESDIPHYSIRMKGNFTGIHDLMDLLAVRKIILRNNIKVIHCHRGKDHWLSVAAARSLPLKKRPKIVRTRHVVVPVKRHFLNRLLYKYWTDRVIAVSEKAASSLHGLPMKNDIAVIYASVDSTRFSPEKRSEEMRRELGMDNGNSQAPLIGIVGRLQRIKGQAVFLRAAAKVSEFIPHAGFVIAGKGSDVKRRRLINLAEKIGVSEKLKILGYTDNIESLIASLDVGVIASLGSEGSSRICLEYMASGVPVVATRVGGIPEILECGELGNIVEPGDSEELGTAVIRAFLNKYRSRNLADVALQKARTFHSIDRFIQQTLEVYE